MKKLFVLLLSLLLFVINVDAQQRLAVFESTLSGAENLLSICVDAFERGPEGEAYGLLGRTGFEGKYITEGHTSFDIRAKDDLPPGTGVGFFGPENKAIPDYYKRFIENEVGEFKRKEEELSVLQNRIWAYDAMDHLGLINHGAADQSAEFIEARSRFAYRYNLGQVNADADNLDRLHRDINYKAYEIYLNRKETLAGAEEFTFTQSSIKYKYDGEDFSITPHFNGVEFSDVERLATEVENDIKIFNQDYLLLPDRADFSRSPVNPRNYHFVFSADGDSYYTMKFVHTNNSGFIFRTLEFELAKGPILEPKNKRYAFSIGW